MRELPHPKPGRPPVPAASGRPLRRGARGFVLTEVITVAVIVGILAAVAIPIYTGYIRGQKRDVAKNIAKSGAAAANIYCRRVDCATSPPDSAALKLFLSDPAGYTVKVQGDYVIVTDVSNGSDTLQAAVKFK